MEAPAGSCPVVLPIVCYGDGNWGIVLAMEFIQGNPKSEGGKEYRINYFFQHHLSIPHATE